MDTEVVDLTEGEPVLLGVDHVGGFDASARRIVQVGPYVRLSESCHANLVDRRRAVADPANRGRSVGLGDPAGRWS